MKSSKSVLQCGRLHEFGEYLKGLGYVAKTPDRPAEVLRMDHKHLGELVIYSENATAEHYYLEGFALELAEHWVAINRRARKEAKKELRQLSTTGE